MSDVKIEIDNIHTSSIYFDWGGAGIGFGQLSVNKNGDSLICNNECMSRQQVRELLIAFANHVADIVTLIDNNESLSGFKKIPPIIEGVVKITKGNEVLKEGMYVERVNGVYTNPYTNLKMPSEETADVESICIRGQGSKEEMVAKNKVLFGII